jgi:hypothetical protein
VYLSRKWRLAMKPLRTSASFWTRTIALLVGSVAASFASAGLASIYGTVDVRCPLCSTKFKVMRLMSSFVAPSSKDLRPITGIGWPSALPECPECHFVMFKDDIPGRDWFKCRELVASANYKEHSKRAEYYLLGLIYEKLGKDDATLGETYMKAAITEEKDTANFKEDLKLAEKHFAAFVTKDDSHEKEWQNAQMLIGEIKRRAGEFDEAKKHFETVNTLKEFRDIRLGEIIDYQMKLIAKKDSDAHTMEDLRKSK